MNCSNCGAPLEWQPGSRVAPCAYCHSRQIPTFEQLASDRLNWNQAPGAHSCPDCGMPLESASLDGCAAEACRGCSGLLLVDTAFAELVRTRRAAYAGPDRSVEPLDTEHVHTARHCPGCDKPMETHPYYGPGRQVIESCARCGLIWLDCGELTAIEQAAGRR